MLRFWLKFKPSKPNGLFVGAVREPPLQRARFEHKPRFYIGRYLPTLNRRRTIHRAPTRRLLLVCALLAILLFALPAAAQEATPIPSVDPVRVERAERAAADAEDAAEQARRYAEDGSNYLNIYQSVGVAIGVLTGVVVPLLAVVAGIVGLTRLREARSELTQARERVERDLESLRASLTDELREKQAELDAVKDELRESARIERVRSEQATLALSLLPLGDRQYRVNDFDGALDTYRRALSLDPDNVVIHYRIGYVCTQQGNLDEATTHLARALELEPDFAPALANLGYVLRRRAERLPADAVERGHLMAEAELNLRQALSISPRLVDEDGESWWGSLGGLHRRRGQIDDAIDAYRRALEVTPQASYPVGNLAMLYMHKHDPARMLEAYQRAERLASRAVLADGGDFWSWADLLTARLAQGKYAEAKETLEWVLSLAPESSPYMLRSPLDTLRQLAQLQGADAAHPLQPFIGALESRLNQHEPQSAK